MQLFLIILYLQHPGEFMEMYTFPTEMVDRGQITPGKWYYDSGEPAVRRIDMTFSIRCAIINTTKNFNLIRKKDHVYE
jgi:hypothetical protein